jgi:tRNA (cytidine/uridine-2'-O-)-methyltransferase
VHVVLVHPEIATNTGGIIRLCANTGVTLHLVEPLGFSMENRLLRRAGLDYHEFAQVVLHPDVATCTAALGDRRRFAFTSHATSRYDRVAYTDDDVFVFGSEGSGLSAADLSAIEPAERLVLPMRPNNRSLNLANAVAIVVYEAWRQLGFAGAATRLTPAPQSGLTSETTTAEPFDR